MVISCICITNMIVRIYLSPLPLSKNIKNACMHVSQHNCKLLKFTNNNKSLGCLVVKALY